MTLVEKNKNPSKEFINCTHQEWAIDFMKLLKNKFLAQEYPECLVNQELERALQVDRADLLFRDKKDKKKRSIFNLTLPTPTPFKQFNLNLNYN